MSKSKSQFPRKRRAKGRLDPADYEVGYGKPPVDGQFKPHQSGNLRGRPPSRPNLKTIVARALTHKRPVMIAGQKCKLPTLDIIFRRLVEKAVGDDTKVALSVIAIAQEHAPQLMSDLSARSLSADDRKIIAAAFARLSTNGAKMIVTRSPMTDTKNKKDKKD
jgi:hypothetical protein